MERINDQDTRGGIIRKFDHCMEQLFERSQAFLNEITRINTCDEDSSKIYLLALALALDLRLICDNARCYEREIKDTMLDLRIDIHVSYKRRIETDLMLLRARVNRIIQSQSLGLHTYEMPVRDGEEAGPHRQEDELCSLVRRLSRTLDENTLLIFKEIDRAIGYLEQMVTELSALMASRTDEDYRRIYNLSRERYERSAEWKDFKDRYIHHHIQVFYDRHPEKIDSDVLEKCIRDEERRAMEDKELEYVWVAHKDNPVGASRYFVSQQHAADATINRFFQRLCIIEHLNDQKAHYDCQKALGKETCRPAGDVAFVRPYSEECFRRAWDDIYSYMQAHEAATGYQWCCLHHALAFDNRINDVTFLTFMRWLRGWTHNDGLMTDNSIHQYKTNYFVATTAVEWNLEQYRIHITSGKDKSRKSNRHFDKIRNGRMFTVMCGMAEDLRKIIRKHA